MAEYRKGNGSVLVKGSTIRFTCKKLFGGEVHQSFSLSEVSGAKLRFMPPQQNKGIQKNDDDEQLAFLGENLFLRHSYKLEWVTTGHGGGLINPYPVALFYAREKPVFFIDFNRGPGKEKPLLECMEQIAPEKFDKELLMVKEPEFRANRDSIQRADSIATVLFILLMLAPFALGMIFPYLLFGHFVKDPAINWDIDPVGWLVALLFFAGIGATVAIVILAYRMLVTKEALEYAFVHPTMLRADKKSTMDMFWAASKISFVVYLVLLVLITTSFYGYDGKQVYYSDAFIRLSDYKPSDAKGVIYECSYDEKTGYVGQDYKLSLGFDHNQEIPMKYYNDRGFSDSIISGIVAALSPESRKNIVVRHCLPEYAPGMKANLAKYGIAE